MAVTLADLSKVETDTLRKSVIDALLMESNLLELVPWETIGQLATTVVMYKDLPSVGWRKVNEGYAESTGTFMQKVENIFLLGGMIDTDKAIARAKNTIADARAIQQTMMLKGLAYHFNNTFINGNPAVTPDGFKGLKLRVADIVADGYTGQSFACGATTNLITSSAAHSHTFLDDLDKLIYSIAGHQPQYLLMNHYMLLILRSVLRREKLLDVTQDMFNRRVDMYQGARLIDIGTLADQSTLVMPWEAIGGTPATDSYASIYAVKFGIGEYLWGIQQYPLEAYDKGLLEAKPVYRTEVDWPVGLAHVNPRCAARLYGIKIK